jgi:hypothetical protein
MRFAISVFVLCTAFLCVAQRLELKTLDPILYFNDENGQLTVIDDSNWVRTYSVQGALLSSQKVLNKVINMQELKQEFIPVMLHKKLHFVERGCGRVLRFDNGTLERIDHSFSHRNQYDALIISFHDTLYCIGGYGFFTVKDHVTYFDEGLGQWFLKNKSPQIRHQISKPMYEWNGNNLLVFGSEIGEHANQRTEPQTSLMEFSFNTGLWRKVGELNAEVSRRAKNAWFYSKNTSVGGRYVLLYYPEENKVQSFSQDKTIRQIYTFKDFVVVNQLVMTSYKMYRHVLEFHDKAGYLKSKGTQNFPFKDQVPSERSYPYGLGLLLACLLVVATLFLVIRKILAQKKERTLPEEIHDLLTLWMNAENRAIELSDLNPLVAYDNPELETLKKRREGLLKRLKSFLMENHRFEEDEVYTTELSPRDKRIKLFKLHPKVVKWYNRVK